MSNEPTQPMEPKFFPPPPPWEYQVDWSRQAGVNVYKNHHGEIVAQVDMQWRLYDPERQLILVDDAWIPIRTQGVSNDV